MHGFDEVLAGWRAGDSILDEPKCPWLTRNERDNATELTLPDNDKRCGVYFTY